MARKDRTYTHEDLIRLYRRNLDPMEQFEVRKYFASVVFGGPAYHRRMVTRLLDRTLQFFRGAVDIDPFAQLRNAQDAIRDAIVIVVEGELRDRPYAPETAGRGTHSGGGGEA